MSQVGTVVMTIHGNKLRRFEDGWSPLEGAHWDRWTVYTDAELTTNFTLATPATMSTDLCPDCDLAGARQ